MALSRSRDRAILAPDNLTINDFSNNDVAGSAATSDGVAEDISLSTYELLTAMLTELKITNCHLSELTQCEINQEDVES